MHGAVRRSRSRAYDDRARAAANRRSARTDRGGIAENRTNDSRRRDLAKPRRERKALAEEETRTHS